MVTPTVTLYANVGSESADSWNYIESTSDESVLSTWGVVSSSISVDWNSHDCNGTNWLTVYSCNICHLLFTSEDALHKHNIEYHNPRDIKKCPMCGEKYNVKECKDHVCYELVIVRE